MVHLLVLAAFVGPAPTPQHEGNHRDGDKGNNRLGNLEWATKSQNRLHACRVLGRGRGESNGGGGKLTEAQVVEIKRRLSKGEKDRQLAPLFGVSCGMIGHIRRGHSWQHVSIQ
jgi:hypothetical protein